MLRLHAMEAQSQKDNEWIVNIINKACQLQTKQCTGAVAPTYKRDRKKDSDSLINKACHLQTSKQRNAIPLQPQTRVNHRKQSLPAAGETMHGRRCTNISIPRFNKRKQSAARGKTRFLGLNELHRSSPGRLVLCKNMKFFRRTYPYRTT